MVDRKISTNQLSCLYLNDTKKDSFYKTNVDRDSPQFVKPYLLSIDMIIGTDNLYKGQYFLSRHILLYKYL